MNSKKERFKPSLFFYFMVSLYLKRGGRWSFFVSLLLLLLAISCNKSSKKNQQSPVEQSKAIVGNVEIGKSLFSNCIACHGQKAEGNKKLNSPALANLEDWYLYRQLLNFKNGSRGDASKDTLGFQMSKFAILLKDTTEVADVVAYIKTLPEVTLTPLIEGDIQKGLHYYETICGSCHGTAGKGNVKMNAPSIKGVDDWYVKRQIYNFKDSIRGNHPQDKFGAQMVAMMKLLPNNQAINDVIAYINSTAGKEKK